MQFWNVWLEGKKKTQPIKKNGGRSLEEALSLNDAMCGLEYLGWRGQGKGSSSVSERLSASLETEMSFKGNIPFLHCDNRTIKGREEVQKW